jgi:hypothetical protein
MLSYVLTVINCQHDASYGTLISIPLLKLLDKNPVIFILSAPLKPPWGIFKILIAKWICFHGDNK